MPRFRLEPQLLRHVIFSRRLSVTSFTKMTVQKVHRYLEAPQVAVAAFSLCFELAFSFFQERSDTSRDLHRLRKVKKTLLSNSAPLSSHLMPWWD